VTLPIIQTFELTVSVSCDARLAATVGELAACAAGAAGCPGSAADAFARRVEASVREAFGAQGGGAAMLPVVMRWRAGRVDVRVGDHGLTLDGAE
jgi:hypothetical protein